MIIISNNIKVGLDIPAFCDYYSDLKQYVASLEYFLKSGTNLDLDKVNITLNRLNIYEKNNKLTEEYYFSLNGEDLMVISETDVKLREPKWRLLDKLPEIVKTDFKYTFDLEYFIKNN